MSPMIGSDYSLTCVVSQVTESLELRTTYQWRKENAIIRRATMMITNFLPLRTSDAGRYTCMVTIDSAYLNGNIISQSQNYDLSLICERR